MTGGDGTPLGAWLVPAAVIITILIYEKRWFL